MTLKVEVRSNGSVARAADPAPSLADSYQELARLAGGCPIEAGLIGALADNECAHGFLPSDSNITCACWGAPVEPIVEREEPVTAIASEELPPFVRGLVEQIDAEIARLERARHELTNSATSLAGSPDGTNGYSPRLEVRQ